MSPEGLWQRARLLQAVRVFFQSRSYLEVDTPIRLPVLIPEVEILPIASGKAFLQTSPELCMKRLLAGGCTRLFQICHCFRQGERGRLHQEEFTMLEWYRVGWSYLELMEECEALVQSVVQDCLGAAKGQTLLRQGREIVLCSPWNRMTVDQAFVRYAGCSAQQAVENGAFDALLVDKVEPKLGWERPLFLYDYPLPLASLARRSAQNPQVAERFELYIGGLELANGFSELTDSSLQRQRFAGEIARAEENGRELAMPELFLQDLDAVPECAGIAFGLDRLLMLCAGVQSIAEVQSFSPEDL